MDKSLITELDSIVIEYVKNQISYELYKDRMSKKLQSYITLYRANSNEIKELWLMLREKYLV